MKKTSYVRFIHGDEIPGIYCNTRCHRCDKKIKRTSTDIFRLAKCSLKVIGSMSIEGNGEIELTWAHLCRECIDEYVKWFNDFMGKSHDRP